MAIIAWFQNNQIMTRFRQPAKLVAIIDYHRMSQNLIPYIRSNHKSKGQQKLCIISVSAPSIDFIGPKNE